MRSSSMSNNTCSGSDPSKAKKLKARTTRRTFLTQTAGVAVLSIGAPYFAPATALGFGSRPAPSDRIVMGAIGCGGKGQHNTRDLMKDDRVQFVAVCDVDKSRLKNGQKLVNAKYGNEDCATFEDLRELVSRPDIDAVHVSTPDHWHALASVRALKAGKHVYCEKPLANSVGESKLIRDTQKQTGLVVQCGSHERSNNNCRLAAELVRSGRIGKLETVRIHLPCSQKHHLEAKGFVEKPTETEAPKHLNWDLWQGHTGPTEYWEKGCHFWWRFILKYGGGEMTDRGAHVIDIAQLALDMDESGPVSYQAKGKQVEGSPYDTFWDYSFVNTYANGVKMIGSSAGDRGVKFEGTDGWIFVAIHGGKLSASNPDILPENVRDGGNVGVDQVVDDLSVQLGRSPGHHRNFIDCVVDRSRQPMATAEIGHRTATICHLNNIAMMTGKNFRWDPQLEELIGDGEAGSQLLPQMRDPWSV